MRRLLEENELFDIEELIVNTPSFQKIVEDQRITEEEKLEQMNRVLGILKEIEQKCDKEVLDLIRRLFAETCVMVAINRQQ